MMHNGLWRRAAMGVMVYLACVCPGSAVEPTDSTLGTRVVTKNGIVPRPDNHTVVELRKTRQVFKVERAYNDWYWIAGQEIAGWVNVADVIPLDRAMDYLTGEIKENPNAGWAYLMRGIVWEEMNEPDIALADYNEALRQDPNDAEAHLRRANVRQTRKHDPEGALTDYNAALRLDPTLIQAYRQRAQALMAKQRFELAIADYNEAIRLDGRDITAYHGRALANQAKGNLDDAIEDLTTAIRLGSNDPVVYLNRGNAWSDKQEYDKAIADYSEAIKLDRHYAAAFHNRGIASRLKKDYDKAISDHNVAIRLAPKDPAAYLARGVAWKKMKEYDRALADYSEALRLDPKNAEALNGRAWILATCPEAHIRNGKIAYDFALRACEISGWKAANHLDTLAAAYAESRDFTHATEWENKALEAAVSADEKAEFMARLQLYEKKKAYRDEPAVDIESRPLSQPRTSTASAR